MTTPYTHFADLAAEVAPPADGTLSRTLYNDDHTLQYLTTGDLAGYTLLTVGVVPEPASLYLLCIGLAAMLLGRRR